VLAGHALLPRLVAHGAHALGGHDDLVTFSLKPAADDLLGAADGVEVAAEGIDVGRVDEVDAGVVGGVEDGHRRRLVTLQAERHRAEAQLRDAKASPPERHVVHGGDLGRLAGIVARSPPTVSDKSEETEAV
jgi:hypothetical protein